jgi:hypothetical protein
MSVPETQSDPTNRNVRLIPGGIYKLKDDLVKFPDTEARNLRTRHDHRTVLVMSSAAVCHSDDYGCVIVAPMSHLVKYCAGVDVIVNPSRQNGLNAPGRVLLSYMQPAIKTDLTTKIGVMSDEDWQVIMAAVISGLDH